MESRYDRQLRIPKWNQSALAKATILLAGAGALGNEILKNLALLGVGKILVVDFDTIEISNLSRTVLFRDTDLGRSKAECATAAAKSINPEIDIRYIHGDLFFDIGLGFYRHADLIISGLDNIAARSKVGQCAYQCGKPFIDSGIWAMGGEVRCFWPGEGFCYDCTLSDTDWQNAHLRRSCTGFKALEQDQQPPTPSNIITASVIGGLVAQEVLHQLNGVKSLDSGDALIFNGFQQSLHSSRLPGEEKCLCRLGNPLDTVTALDVSVDDLTAGECWEIATQLIENPVCIELGRDVLMGYSNVSCIEADCPFTNFEPGLMAKIPESEQICSHCNVLRQPIVISSFDASFKNKNLTMKQLGVPNGEILSVWNKEKVCYFEFKGDVDRFWA